MNKIEQNLLALGFTLPDSPKPLGNFAAYLIDGNHLYVSGQIAVDMQGKVVKGKLGDNISVEQGQEAAAYCAVNLLARTKAALDGDLDRIQQLIKLGAFVNAEPDFTEHPQVVNGASDLMFTVLGQDKGNHVRFAVGSSSLPAGACVEIEALFRIQV